MTDRIHKQVTASTIRLTGERFCASCAAYRSLEFGAGTLVKRNGRTVRWNCQNCANNVKNRERELKNGKAA